MGDYKNIILLKDFDSNRVDAIIFTNETVDTIDAARQTAVNMWYKEEYPDCELEYVLDYISSKYDIYYIDAFRDGIDNIYY